MMVDSLINVLNSISPINEEEADQIRALVSIKQLNVGDYWFYEGLYTDRVAFVVKGYLRKYFLVDGNEKTDFFYFENDFTGDLPSILAKEPCKSFNVAMEPCTLLVMSHKDIDKLAENSPNIDHLLRILAEQWFITYYKKATAFILQSPKERYQELIELQPQLLQRVTQYHIASYLGITPQHLSRLKAPTQ